MTEYEERVRGSILSRTPHYVNYDLPLEERIRPLLSKPDELASFYNTYQPQLPLSSDDLRICAAGLSDDLLDRRSFPSEFEQEYGRVMTAFIAELPSGDHERDASEIERLIKNPSILAAHSPNEGWAMALLSGARQMNFDLILAAVAADPANVIARWSLIEWLDDDSRSLLARALAGGTKVQQGAAIALLQQMFDAGGDTISPNAIDTLRNLPRAVRLHALGRLLVHYFIWLRQLAQPNARAPFFNARFDVLSSELSSLGPSSDETAETIADATLAEVEVAAFFHGALGDSATAAGEMALRDGINRFRSTFAPLRSLSVRDGYVNLFSYGAYLHFAIEMPLDSLIFGALIRGLFADEISYALEPEAYLRDRARAIILCTIAANVSKSRGDNELAAAVRTEAALLSELPPLRQACINDAFVVEVKKRTGISVVHK